MLRLLLIIALVVYALYKLGVFRVFISSAKEGYGPDQINKKPPGGNVNIDAAPPKEARQGNVKGGEYVDYEEVKE